MGKTQTPSAHAQGDLAVGDPRTSADFIEILNKAQAPLPWSDQDGIIFDADGEYVCEVGPGAEIVAAMIVVAVNTCGSFRASRREE